MVCEAEKKLKNYDDGHRKHKKGESLNLFFFFLVFLVFDLLILWGIKKESFLIADLEGADSDLHIVQQNIKLVSSAGRNVHDGSVGSVPIINDVDGWIGHSTVCLLDRKGIEGKEDGVTMLISGLDGDGKVLVG